MMMKRFLFSKESRTQKHKIPATLDQLENIGGWVADLLEPLKIEHKSDLTYTMQLAVHEVCVNIIEHAYANSSGTIDLTLSVHKGQFVAETYDTGALFAPTEVAPPAFGELQERGFGLFLVDELMDEVTYTSQRGRNSWRLVKNLGSVRGVS